MEGDPKPGALMGRMSFQNCNATVDVRILVFAYLSHDSSYVSSDFIFLFCGVVLVCLTSMGVSFNFLEIE